MWLYHGDVIRLRPATKAEKGQLMQINNSADFMRLRITVQQDPIADFRD